MQACKKTMAVLLAFLFLCPSLNGHALAPHSSFDNTQRGTLHRHFSLRIQKRIQERLSEHSDASGLTDDGMNRAIAAALSDELGRAIEPVKVAAILQYHDDLHTLLAKNQETVNGLVATLTKELGEAE